MKPGVYYSPHTDEIVEIMKAYFKTDKDLYLDDGDIHLHIGLYRGEYLSQLVYLGTL